jgi:predicted aspartyl protease
VSKKQVTGNSVPRNRSERQYRHTSNNSTAHHTEESYVWKEKMIKDNNNENDIKKEDSVSAVYFDKGALINKYTFMNNEHTCEFNCLIDTGATISTINVKAWERLGKPEIKSSQVGPILLGDDRQVCPEGVVHTMVRIGSHTYPISLLVLRDWRYEILMGLDFLREIGATVDIRKGVKGEEINYSQAFMMNR